MKEEEEINKLEKNLQKRASQQELFEKKVFLIGELHARRALLANRLGRVKSECLMRHNDEEHEARKEALAMEEEMAGISSSITDFRPESIEDLKSFQKTTHLRFDEAEKKIVGAESKLD